MNPRRLSRPVSESWSASRRSSRSVCLRSPMSSIWSDVVERLAVVAADERRAGGDPERRAVGAEVARLVPRSPRPRRPGRSRRPGTVRSARLSVSSSSAVVAEQAAEGGVDLEPRAVRRDERPSRSGRCRTRRGSARRRPRPPPRPLVRAVTSRHVPTQPITSPRSLAERCARGSRPRTTDPSGAHEAVLADRVRAGVDVPSPRRASVRSCIVGMERQVPAGAERARRRRARRARTSARSRTRTRPSRPATKMPTGSCAREQRGRRPRRRRAPRPPDERGRRGCGRAGSCSSPDVRGDAVAGRRRARGAALGASRAAALSSARTSLERRRRSGRRRRCRTPSCSSAIASSCVQRRPVDAGRDERVVDVADGEDPRVERDVVGGEAGRDTRLPSSRSWWSRTRRRTDSEKPPSSSISFAPHSAWRLTTLVLVARRAAPASSGSRRAPRACRCRGRAPPIASVRSRLAESPSALADLDGAQRDAARVLLGVLVLLGEPERDRADVRAEEDLLGGDEIGGAGGRRRAGATEAVCARSSATGMPTIRIPSSSNMCPSHQPRSE